VRPSEQISVCRGYPPPDIESLEQQSIRAYEAFKAKTTHLERHIYVRQLQDNNEILFYRLLLDHVEEMLPIVIQDVAYAVAVQANDEGLASEFS
jgi:malate dehydrogenase (oxaloacetate-decarboxylating)